MQDLSSFHGCRYGGSYLVYIRKRRDGMVGTDMSAFFVEMDIIQLAGFVLYILGRKNDMMREVNFR